ncbi:homoserine dehydrogenase [Vulcanisaeta thermophila]|uniref:homoserine dehydrogenase n=1 Tax=Vulcanisaeta thermophila TaxID=867917 RepID=UPI000852C714|nr:homoserine dehydrogenase [Vulcanisaeta thermophila]
MIKIMIVGFGNVGQGFFELLNARRDELGIDAVVTEIVDRRRGFIRNPGPEILPDARAGRQLGVKVDPEDIPRLITESDANVVCEFTDLNIRDKGEPAFTYITTAMRSGKHVITTNKGPVAFHYDELMELSRRYNVGFGFKGTVMAGTPSFNVLELLPGAHVEYFQGILNGTTNFILTKMHEGLSFNDALRLAQEMGYAEADPSLDIDGVDPALKAIIISRVLGWRHSLDSMEVVGIRNIEMAGNGVVKLIAYADEKRAFVKPMVLDPADPMAHVNGNLNAIKFKLDTLGSLIIIGPGAGRVETAQAVLTDLMSIVRRYGLR